jgi:hypothetical protein
MSVVPPGTDSAALQTFRDLDPITPDSRIDPLENAINCGSKLAKEPNSRRSEGV